MTGTLPCTEAGAAGVEGVGVGAGCVGAGGVEDGGGEAGKLTSGSVLIAEPFAAAMLGAGLDDAVVWETADELHADALESPVPAGDVVAAAGAGSY